MDTSCSDREAESLRVFRTDELTGLYNRAYFFERVRDDMERSQRYSWPVSLVVMALDDFDAVRARIGPFAADQLLATIGSMISKSFRGTDLAARIGDSMFGLLLPGADVTGAMTIAQRLKERVEGLVLEGECAAATPSSCGIGIVQYDTRIDDVAQFSLMAERALRRAQHGGRGQIAVESLPPPEPPSVLTDLGTSTHPA